MPPLPVNNSAALFTANDLDASQASFAAWLAREEPSTVIGLRRSATDNPLAQWIRDQVVTVTHRRDWLVQVSTACIDIAGPTKSDRWHALVLATPRWAKDWFSRVSFHYSTRRELTTAQARYCLEDPRG